MKQKQFFNISVFVDLPLFAEIFLLQVVCFRCFFVLDILNGFNGITYVENLLQWHRSFRDLFRYHFMKLVTSNVRMMNFLAIKVMLTGRIKSIKFKLCFILSSIFDIKLA